MLAAGMGRGDGGEENILGMRMVGEGGDIAQSWAKNRHHPKPTDSNPLSRRIKFSASEGGIVAVNGSPTFSPKLG